MKYLFILGFSVLIVNAQGQYQEVTLDSLKNKKVIEMSIDDFEKMKKQEENKQKLKEAEKEKLASQKVFSKPVIEEVIIDNGETIEEDIVKPVVVAKAINIQEPKQVIEVKKEIEEVKKPLGAVEELSSLALEQSISYYLAKYKDLTVYEFEQSKTIIIEKIKQDKRFDLEVLNSMNITTLNKMQFLDFLAELKNSIRER